MMAQEKVQLPRPTGSYNVGVHTCFLKDTSRPLLVHMYYPSAETQKEFPRYLADTMHLYKEKIARTHIVLSRDLEYLDSIRDWAVPDAPIDAARAPFPVLFFSHGFFMAAQLYSSLIEEMASYGYVVVAINHTDACWPVIFPDGSSPVILPELAHIFSSTTRSCMQTFDMTQETWLKDVGVVILWLRNQPLAKFFDFTRMGIFGHSFGGSVATGAARRYKDFKAMANLDGLLFGSDWDQPVETPSLFVVAEKQLTHEEALKVGLTIEQCDNLLARSSKKLFDPLKDNSLYVTIKNTDHASFVDSKIIKSPLLKNSPDSLRGIGATRALLVDFFDQYLRNKKSTVLKAQSLRFPDVLIEKK